MFPLFVDCIPPHRRPPTERHQWNVSPFHTPDRYMAPLITASSARVQGWEALMQFAYSFQPLNGPINPSKRKALTIPNSQP
jgi:hypothetical protein